MKAVYVVLSLILATLPLSADLSQFTRRDPRLVVHPINTRYDKIAGYQAQSKAWDDKFKGQYGPEWEILVDVRGGRPGRVAGQGIPVIPGLGNTLNSEVEIGSQEIETLARSFLQKNATLFMIDPAELRVGDVIQMDDFWYVNFHRTHKNLPVRGATALIMISHGNLVRLLTTAYGDINLSTTPTYSADEAREQMFREIGGTWVGFDTVIEPGELEIRPIFTNGATMPEYTGGVGEGYGHLLTWRIVFERESEGTWTAVMDASTNRLLEFYSHSASGYSEGAVTGNVHYYPAPGVPAYGQPMPEKGVRMPYADLRYHFTTYDGTDISCYASGQGTCRTPGAANSAEPFCLKENTISCPDIFDKKYCSGWSGRFCYPEPLTSPDALFALDSASPLMTRMISSYAMIHQYYNAFKDE